MALQRISPKYQLTLPEDVRGSLKVGDYLEAVPTNGGILLRPTAVVEIDIARSPKRPRQ